MEHLTQKSIPRFFFVPFRAWGARLAGARRPVKPKFSTDLLTTDATALDSARKGGFCLRTENWEPNNHCQGQKKASEKPPGPSPAQREYVTIFQKAEMICRKRKRNSLNTCRYIEIEVYTATLSNTHTEVIEEDCTQSGEPGGMRAEWWQRHDFCLSHAKLQPQNLL